MSVFFCDTNCELWHETAKELGITNIIRMPYTICNEEHFYDLGEKHDYKNFFNLVKQGNMPITSALNAEDYKGYFEPFFAKGEEILYVSFSSKMSGTFNNLEMALKELKVKYPAAKFTRYDTKGISMAAGISVYAAAKEFNAGKSIPEIVAFLDDLTPRVNAFCTVDDLNHLKRGGRLSAIQALVGGLLQIKPIIKLTDEGSLVPFEKAKGRVKALNTISDEIIATATDLDKYPIVIMEGDCKDDCDKVAARIQAGLPNATIWKYSIGPVIGTHCGPGTIAACFVGPLKPTKNH